MARELDNWTIEMLPEPASWKIINTKNSLQINSTTLAPNDVGKSSRQDEEEETEEEALKELERLLEQERSKLQSGTEELEVINLGKEESMKIKRV
ncbi:hypothetical protein CR513_03336, partial [Mucuna pruriens]